ncbi:phosphocholine-specific phospholipase C [Chitinophaga barathri]|uniref:phospholipase C n=1 Tax=Chitinophaga barathri TaxID=1647451 RepID=A0A3N4M7Y4_9BACT|nr:phospholipase C, phosphocholine-specific [Chitinophaga barathri]RPD39375.1 phospholipase C, phosphocholine-specific [Chitinophaga barathri]
MDSRREFLRKAALLTGTGGLATMLPDTIRRAMAINPAPGSTFLDAEHVVFLMQENRSFDHCFGTLKGVRGFNDPRALKTPEAPNVFFQKNDKGEYFTPFRMDIKDTKATWMSALPHSWSDQVDARNHGHYDRWLDVKRSGNREYSKMPLTMGYYNREDIPFYYALADAFTVCDQHFCSSLTGTTPNRLYFWTGTIREEAHPNVKANVWNSDVDYGKWAKWKTFPEVLEENNVSWKIYQNEISVGVGFEGEEDSWLANFTDNPIEWFSQYHVQYHEPHLAYLRKMKEEMPAHLAQLEKELEGMEKGSKTYIDQEKKIAGRKNALQQALDTLKLAEEKPFSSLPAMEQQLHRKAFTTNRNDPDYHSLSRLQYKDGETEREVQLPKGDILHQLRQDVKNNELPAVSWIVAPENFSDHPGAPWYGAWYLSEVMDILTQNPEVWKKTIFVLTYDENDGYFDHVPPFTAPAPGAGKVSPGIDASLEWVTKDAQAQGRGVRESSIGLGYRVPMVVASPWSRGGFVNSQVFDHTSNLQFLETFLSNKLKKKIKTENISGWRRAVCGDLTSIFRPYNGEKISTPASLEKESFIETIHNAKFKAAPANFRPITGKITDAAKYMPEQERGIRPACAIPYELIADILPGKDGKTLALELEARNKLFKGKSAGAAFNVYGAKMENRSYAVSAGDKISDEWTGEELSVYGPNGFFRSFKGKTGKFPPVVVRGGDTVKGDFVLTFLNPEKKPVNVYISHAHTSGKASLKVEGRYTATYQLGLTHGWYDITLKLPDYGAEYRFAGHVETGKASFSDPVMGRDLEYKK